MRKKTKALSVDQGLGEPSVHIEQLKQSWQEKYIQMACIRPFLLYLFNYFHFCPIIVPAFSV